LKEYTHKLNPLPIALSVISSQKSDDFLQIIHSAGVAIDLSLTREENYSNTTRIRVYLPRVNKFIQNLDDENALKIIYLIFNEVLKNGENKTNIKNKLQNIGWDLINNSIVPINSEVIELYFEKGLVHSAYQKIKNIVHSSTKEIYVIDPYIDSSIFELFKVFTVENLQIKILTFKKPSDYDHEKNLFLTQYKNLKIEEKTTKDFHDRFIIIDKKDTFHIGASIKDAGKSVFMINKIEDIGICSEIIDSFNKRWI
jgi:hypothetical protein